MSIEDYIPKRLEELFEKYEVSRYRISQKCGIPTTAISKIISKKNVPTIITLERIVMRLGTRHSSLMMGADMLNYQEYLWKL